MRDPARVIPRAIVVALAGAVVVYALVGVAVLTVLGPEAPPPPPRRSPTRSPRPLGWAEPVVRVGAALAAAGALLALVAGLGRTTLAMAREGDLPRWLDAVHPRFQVPHRAELSIAAVVVVLVLLVGPARRDRLLVLRRAALLLRRQCRGVGAGPAQRRYPRWLQALGCAGCLVLVATLPWESVVAGAAVFGVGTAYRWPGSAVEHAD